MRILPDLPGIYKIENVLDGKFYIGSAVNLRKRRNRHFSELRKQTHYNTHLKRAFMKYGEKSFIFSIILICEVDELFRYEKAIIDKLKPEYNVRLDCTTNRGIKYTIVNINSLKALQTPKTKEQLKARSLTLILNRIRKKPDTGTQELPNGRFRAMSGIKGNHIGCYSTREEAKVAYYNYVMEKYS